METTGAEYFALGMIVAAAIIIAAVVLMKRYFDRNPGW